MLEVVSAFIKDGNNSCSSNNNVNMVSPSTCSEGMNIVGKRVPWEPESGSILDPFHIEDLLDFSNEDIAGPIGEEHHAHNSSSPAVAPPVTPTNNTATPTASGDMNKNNTSTPSSQQQHSVDHSTNEFSIDCDAMPELEWLSSLVEDDTFSMGELHKNMFIGSKGGGAPPSPNFSTPSISIGSKRSYESSSLLIEEHDMKDAFQVGSPISVLESSSSGTSGNINNNNNRLVTVGKDVSVPGRPRSKRSRTSSPRSSAWNNTTSAPLVVTTSLHHSPTTSSISDKDFVSSEDNSSVYEDGVDSLLTDDHLLLVSNSPQLKPPTPLRTLSKPPLKAVTAPPPITGTQPVNVSQNGEAQPRRCTHCLSQKTPQWRAGPEGPKTLCNACGVRFKSGRLFPEYRPALSPTFVSEVHSNSHRKVLEMRRHKEVHHRGPASITIASTTAGEVVDGGLIYK